MRQRSECHLTDFRSRCGSAGASEGRSDRRGAGRRPRLRPGLRPRVPDVAGGRDEGREIASEKLAALQRLSWAELDSYGTRAGRVTAPSGRTYRVKCSAYWDMGAWESGMELTVKVYARRGLRRLWPYTAHGDRGGADDPVPSGPQEH
jgi:hypothetical protein